MIKFFAILSLAALSACGTGNPLENGGPDDGGGDGGGNASTLDLLPGTTSASSRSDITRHEALNTPNTGDGFAEDINYDPETDTFAVDNLGFDGANSYRRGTAVSDLGPFRVYEGPNRYPDDVTGTPINQFLHRAIYGESPDGKVNFAIVRTGSYVPYGFGGFVYNRTGSVTLQNSGQAHYAGDYAALRDFNGRGGIEYATGDMEMAIDFNDFNEGNAIQGTVFNRAILDVNGNDITDTVITAINDDQDSTLTALPTLVFEVGPGVMDTSGEITGNVGSFVTGSGGASKALESGKYYGVLSGAGADQQVVGVIVVESDDPRYTGVKVRETGGFILHG